MWHLVAKTKAASPQHKLFVSPSFRVLSVQTVAIATRSWVSPPELDISNVQHVRHESTSYVFIDRDISTTSPKIKLKGLLHIKKAGFDGFEHVLEMPGCTRALEKGLRVFRADTAMLAGRRGSSKRECWNQKLIITHYFSSVSVSKVEQPINNWLYNIWGYNSSRKSPMANPGQLTYSPPAATLS